MFTIRLYLSGCEGFYLLLGPQVELAIRAGRSSQVGSIPGQGQNWARPNSHWAVILLAQPYTGPAG